MREIGIGGRVDGSLPFSLFFLFVFAFPFPFPRNIFLRPFTPDERELQNGSGREIKPLKEGQQSAEEPWDGILIFPRAPSSRYTRLDRSHHSFPDHDGRIIIHEATVEEAKENLQGTAEEAEEGDCS